MKALNISQKFTKFNTNWHPHQIAIVDDMQVILAKLKGEFVWHAHENEDELFQVIKGTLYMQFRDKTEIVNEGEIIVIPKGVEHNPCTKNNERYTYFFLKNYPQRIQDKYNMKKHKHITQKYK